jgi:autotransporter-associated beta strand protein
MTKVVALLASVLMLLTIDAGTARAQFTWATDNAGNYGGNWTNGSDGGSGFGAWGFGVGANTGNFIGNPANDGMGTTGIGTTAFGLYATGNQFFTGGRAFDSAMQVGDSFTFWWAMNWDANGGSKGIDLKANNATIYNINNGGSEAITTSNGTADSTFGLNPMFVTATRTSGSTYAFSMTRRSAGTFSTTFNSTAALDSFNLYIGNQNNGDARRNIYFNNFQVANSGTYNFGGTVTESRALTGGGALTVSGNTTLTLTSGGNTFSGGSTVAAGSTLQVGTGGANGSLAGNVVNNGTLTFNSTSVTSYGGQITGSGTLIKSAAGVLSLTGNSSAYAGATLVQAGTLALNGSLGGSVDVSLNAILSGTGTIGGNASIAGTHTPGGTGAVGTQTVNGSLTYAAGSILNWDLFANSGVNGSFDQVVIPTGNLTFAGATSIAMSFNGASSAVAWSNSFWDVSRSWLVQDLGSGQTNNFGNLSLSTQNWLDSTGAAFNTARPGSSFTLTQQGQDVLITYVPEPSTIVALIGGLAGVAGFSIRRRRGC